MLPQNQLKTSSAQFQFSDSHRKAFLSIYSLLEVGLLYSILALTVVIHIKNVYGFVKIIKIFKFLSFFCAQFQIFKNVL